jgi:hypothetical protein
MRKALIGCLLILSVLPARAADQVPPQIGAFVLYCKTNSKGCADKISGISFAMLVTSPIDHKWCPTKDADDVDVLAPKVLQWLAAHREVNNMKTDDGIQSALSQLYPCKR